MSKCVCEGNWRLIIEETEPLFGAFFSDSAGGLHRLVGVLWGDDDFYYVMWDSKRGQYTLSSCVGSLETNGYKLVLSKQSE